MSSEFYIFLLISLLAFICKSASGDIGQGCSAYCNTCTSKNTFTECSSTCRSNWIYDSSTKTCAYNSTYYGLVYEAADIGTISGEAGNCSITVSGFTQFSGIMGNWGAGTTVSILNEILPPHFKVRTIISVLCSDFCNSTKTTITVDGTIRDSKDTSNAKLNNANSICNQNSRSEKYRVLDTGDVTHNNTAANTVVNLVTGGCSGGTCSYGIIQTIVLVALCNDMCGTCYGVENTKCYTCVDPYWLTNNTCDTDCYTGYYQGTSNTCSLCNSNCTACTGSATNCTTCKTNYYLYNNSDGTTPCVKSCGNGLYANSTTGYCQNCSTNCATCTGYTTPCQSCNSPYWLYSNDCIDACPSGYVTNGDSTNRTCELCSTYCIGLNMTIYKSSGGLSPLYVDMKFTHKLNFSSFDMSAFQTFTFSSSAYSISLFNVTYTNLSDYYYKITLQPKGFAFIVNQTVTVTTMALPQTKHTGLYLNPFKDEDYNVTASILWTYMKPPSMTDLQSTIVSNFAALSTVINQATTAPGVQEFKKFGFFLLMFNSLQITSCLVLINMILPQNLYQGIRFFASFIFFDVPTWQEQSSSSRLVIAPPASSYTRVLSTSLSEFRFRRTGFTSVWLFDAYSQIILILCCYLVLYLVRYLCNRYRRLKRYLPYVTSALSSFHEISIMYVTLSIMFDFVYFDSNNFWRYVSVGVCILVNVYYVGLHYVKYYDLLAYPGVALTSPQYQRYVLYYGHFLRNIRYEEYPTDQKPSLCNPCQQWTRPHNYHLLSYVKKILMMLAFPLFYDYGQYQIIVLICIQFLEICRFCLTWPFNSTWRNVFRLILEITLFTVFITVLVIQKIITQLTGGSATQSDATMYYTLGWVGFAFVMFFNFGFLVLTLWDISRSCRKTNKELMDENRRDFYFKKLSQYEENNADVPLDMLNEWVKNGNLNNRNLDILPNVNVRIEYYRINQVETSLGEAYEVQIKNIMQARMDTEFNFRKENNNVVPIRTFECNVVLTEESEPLVYKSIHNAYQSLVRRGTNFVTIKTFSRVEQFKYKCGEEVDLRLNKMYHEAELEHGDMGEIEKLEIKDLLPGFPIPETLLNRLQRVPDHTGRSAMAMDMQSKY